jgi:hypothetical protein
MISLADLIVDLYAGHVLDLGETHWQRSAADPVCRDRMSPGPQNPTDHSRHGKDRQAKQEPSKWRDVVGDPYLARSMISFRRGTESHAIIPFQYPRVREVPRP